MKVTARVFNDILKFRKGDILFFFFFFPFPSENSSRKILDCLFSYFIIRFSVQIRHAVYFNCQLIVEAGSLSRGGKIGEQYGGKPFLKISHSYRYHYCSATIVEFERTMDFSIFPFFFFNLADGEIVSLQLSKLFK